MIAVLLAISATLNVCQAVIFWLYMFGMYNKEQEQKGKKE